MASDLPQESKASLEESLQDLSLANRRPGPDMPRLVVRPVHARALSDSTQRNKETDKMKKKKKNKGKEKVADSWEDELSSGSETEKEEQKQGQEGGGKEKAEDACNSSTSPSAIFDPSPMQPERPLEPPPTPISPRVGGSQQQYQSWSAENSSPSPQLTTITSGSPRIRPAKQTAVANRLIAGALGIRAPKRTEEQRAYDRAIKENEIRRRNREKEEEAKTREAEEQVKTAVWES